jgi:hypothetical protein
MLSTIRLPVWPSPQKNPRKHWLSDDSLQSESSLSLSSSSSTHKSGSSDPFGDWSNSEDDETLRNIPSLGHIFSTSEELVSFAKG